MKNRLNNNTIRDFIELNVPRFFNELKEHETRTNRIDEYNIGEYGEMGLVNFFINGVVRNDHAHRFLIINEFELVNSTDKYKGRVDIMIEDTTITIYL